MKTFLFLSSRFSFKWSKNKAKLSRDFLFLVCRLFILHAPKVLTFKFRTLWFLSIWRQLKFQAGTCWRLLLNSLLRTCELIEKCRTNTSETFKILKTCGDITRPRCENRKREIRKSMVTYLPMCSPRAMLSRTQ